MGKPLRKSSSELVCRMFSAIALAGGTWEHAKWLRLRNGKNARLVQAVYWADFAAPVVPLKDREIFIDDRLDNLPGKKRHATVVALSDAGYDDDFAELLCDPKNAERFVAGIDLAMSDEEFCAKNGFELPESILPPKKAVLSESARKKKFAAMAKVPFNHLSEDELHRTYLAMQRAGFNRRHVNWICNRCERFVHIVESQIDAEKREWVDESGFVIESELRKKMAQPNLESINDMPGLIRRLMNEVIADAGGVGKDSLWIQRANHAERLLSFVEAAMRADVRSAKEDAVRRKASKISIHPPALKTKSLNTDASKRKASGSREWFESHVAPKAWITQKGTLVLKSKCQVPDKVLNDMARSSVAYMNRAMQCIGKANAFARYLTNDMFKGRAGDSYVVVPYGTVLLRLFLREGSDYKELCSITVMYDERITGPRRLFENADKEEAMRRKASRIFNFPSAKPAVVQSRRSPIVRTFTQVLRGVGLLGNKKTAEKAVSRISEIPAAQNVEVQVPEVRVEAAAEVNFEEWRIRDDEVADYFSRSLAEAELSTEPRAVALADDNKTYVDLDGLSDEEKLSLFRKYR
ncbi:MAG: hypothetical protein WC766_01490 [Patescibacteria group bacterium]